MQLRGIVIEFSCADGYSSSVDDSMTMGSGASNAKARKRPHTPYETPTGFMVKGVITLGCDWSDLSTVRVHSEATSLVDATTVGGAVYFQR